MWISPIFWRLPRPLLLLLLPFAMAGCANPGPPRPPSLNLPSPIKDLHADRIGPAVRLAWTVPANSTDDLPNKQPLSAEICRQPDSPKPSATACLVVQHLAVQTGPGTALDPLPPDLLADPVRLLRYQVRLLNPAGRSAEASNPAFAATGQAPAPVTDLHAAPAATGTRLLWQPAETPLAAVLLDRTTTAAAPLAARSHPGKPPSVPGHQSAAVPRRKATIPAHTRLQATPVGLDPGGTLDPSAQRNATYSYVAWRSRSVQVAGRSLTLRSPDSAPLLLTIHDTVPPATPTGLEAVIDRPPAGSPPASSALAIDLSWEAGSEPDLAGYWIERATLPSTPQPPTATPSLSTLEWNRLTPAPVVGPAFRDLPPTPGTYSYRILAVDTTGNLSPPTPPATIRVTQP